MGKGGTELLRRSVLMLMLVMLAALAAAAAAAAATNLSVIGYSIPTAVFPKLISAYQATPAGKDVNFSTSFAASEVQSKAIAAGLPADVVNFSISTDMDRLVQSKGSPVFYLIPKATLQIETPLAAVDGANKAEAQKFVK